VCDFTSTFSEAGGWGGGECAIDLRMPNCCNLIMEYGMVSMGMGLLVWMVYVKEEELYGEEVRAYGDDVS